MIAYLLGLVPTATLLRCTLPAYTYIPRYDAWINDITIFFGYIAIFSGSCHRPHEWHGYVHGRVHVAGLGTNASISTLHDRRYLVVPGVRLFTAGGSMY
jgi:hypothetical protein